LSKITKIIKIIKIQFYKYEHMVVKYIKKTCNLNLGVSHFPPEINIGDKVLS